MFNPELAPLEMVLKQAEKYESLPAEQCEKVNHHLPAPGDKPNELLDQPTVL